MRPANAAITLQLTAARVSGVAPLSVFFDVSTSVASATTRPFHDLEYRWNFGETVGAGVGNWAAGSTTATRNQATGPVAAHVFETPGTYTVCVTATDGINVVDGGVTITVLDPEAVFAGTKTICFSTGGNFAGAPAGMCTVPGVNSALSATLGATAITDPTGDFTAALANFIGAGGKRLLFRAGELWSVGGVSAAQVNVPGPGIIGSYGGGTAKVQSTGGSNIISMGGQPTVTDWRVMDLELDGLSNVNVNAVTANGGMDQTLLLRLNIHDVGVGVIFAFSGLDFANAGGANPPLTLYDQFTLQDSVITNAQFPGAGYAAFVSAARVGILGNTMSNTSAHVMRNQLLYKAVINHNSNSNGGTFTALTVRSTPQASVSVTSVAPFLNTTQWVVISDNAFDPGPGVQEVVTIYPSSPVSPGFDNEFIANVIVERNTFKAGAVSSTALVLQGSEFTVRNNIVDMTGATGHFGISASQSRPNSPASNLVRIYNNSIFSNDVAGTHFAISIDANVTNVTVQNNLAFYPNATGPAGLFTGTGASGLVASDNSSDIQTTTQAPAWVSLTPTVPTDYVLTAASYIPGKGSVPVFSDFFVFAPAEFTVVPNGRAKTGVIDIGATEF